MNATETTEAPAIRLEALGKSYGSTRALKSIDMTVRAGTVHALVGENGAGKSTALGVMAGRTAASTGHVWVFGSEPRAGDPRAARRAGVVAIYQELTIVPALSAEANVFLADPLSSSGFLADRKMRARYEALCARVGVAAAPRGTEARQLSVADQQVLEILRALVSDARIILFDEPTASLAVSERQALFDLIRALRTDGVTIVFVSHNLDEVLEIADEITVFRDGELTVSAPRSEFTKVTLVRAMIGSKGDERVVAELLEADNIGSEAAARDTRAVERLRHSAEAPPVVRVAEVNVPGAIENLSLEVRVGEIVGLGGLIGSGRSTLLRAMAGLEPTSRGRMWIEGREVPWPRTVRRALRYGIALIPEDRKSQGLVLSMSAMDNIVLSDFGGVARFGILSARSVERAAEPLARTFGLQNDRLRHRASQLSGGNQQKLLIARWRHVLPKVLLADEPTRGIDVGAKSEILAALEDMAAAGLGLVIVSSELEEVTAVADRVTVLSEGQMAGTIDRSTQDLTPSHILELAFRLSSSSDPRSTQQEVPQ